MNTRRLHSAALPQSLRQGLTASILDALGRQQRVVTKGRPVHRAAKTATMKTANTKLQFRPLAARHWWDLSLQQERDQR